MHSLSVSYDMAFKMVERARSVIYPNEGFVRQLKLFEEIGMLYNNTTHVT